MYKAKIKNISKERHQVKNNDFLKVSFDILDSDNNVLQSKSIGMFIDSKEEEVTEEVNKHIAEYKREVKKAKAMAEFPLKELKAAERKTFEIEIEAPDIPGKYRYRIGIYNGIFDEQNSNFQKMVVK